MINLFLGVDRYEFVAGWVAAHSAMRKCSVPIRITPLYKHNLSSFMNRDRDPLQSTDFAFSRFLVPRLSDYEGISIFMDADVVVTCDLLELVDYAIRDPSKAVWCVKHNYTPKNVEKFLHQKQSRYEKKNWSSVMVFRNDLCRELTTDVINTQSGLYLHQFKWLDSDELIGELPLEYNWLVGEYANNVMAKIYHWTNGTPCFEDYENCDYAHLWHAEKDDMNSCIQEIQP